MSAIPDSNPTRAQLRLVVLGQWVRAGLDLARGAKAGGGVFGGAVALWRVFQAVRLAIQLIQRLSDLQDALSRAARVTDAHESSAHDSGPCPDDASGVAACLRHALIEISRLIRDALRLAPGRRGWFGAGEAARAEAEPDVPRALGRPQPPRGRPPDQPPRERRWARRRPLAPNPLKMLQTPIAAPAIGRFRLAAG